jgi:hypothetical protein
VITNINNKKIYIFSKPDCFHPSSDLVTTEMPDILFVYVITSLQREMLMMSLDGTYSQ